MSNFMKLVAELDAQRVGARASKNEGGSIMKSIFEGRRKHIESVSVLSRAAKSMSSINRQLTPTRSEVIEQNRRSMTEFRKSLTASVRSNQLSSVDACRLEARANQLSTQLSQRGLI
ncbi:MAG: hypothetical protein PF589_03475 [Gammaproteobacteria bacterium]|jgi:hypothetical protein|nr:hypothetical protein [Gammaproteobacteria bacterium]